MGTKVLWVFIAFAMMISYMVYRCMLTPVDLVTKEYYKDELSYQQVIDAKKHAASLVGSVSLRQGGDGLLLLLPAEMQHRSVDGTVQFYCPNDVKRDRHFDLRVDSAASQRIDPGMVPPGHYTLRVKWTTDGVTYMDERALTVL